MSAIHFAGGSVKKVLIIGGGVIGLCAAYYCAERGMRVTVVERNGERRDGCSYGNTGMVVPSHFVPLAAPGMVALALKWMWNPASPFYIKPRLSLDLARWGFQFMRAANAAHVSRAAPLLARLHMESRALYEKLAASTNFHFEKRGVLVLCRTEHALEEEAALVDQARALGLSAQVLDAKAAAALEPDVQDQRRRRGAHRRGLQRRAAGPDGCAAKEMRGGRRRVSLEHRGGPLAHRRRQNPKSRRTGSGRVRSGRRLMVAARSRAASGCGCRCRRGRATA